MPDGGSAEATQNGIEVENPATGETIATVPELGAEEVARWSPRGARRAAGMGGARLRGPRRGPARRAPLDGRERASGSSARSSPRPAEPADETQFAELSYGLSALEFWAKQAPAYLADEEIESASPFVRGRRLVVRYAPLGVVGVIGPWNYPLNNSFGDCIPALAAGNAVVLKPSEVTPLTSLLMAEMLAECGIPEGVFQVATGRGETGAALIDEVDFVMFTGSVATGKKVMARAARDADPGQPRARRQGPDDRARRRRPRAGRERRGLLRAQQLGPGLHLGRAHLRRGARPRRVPRAADRARSTALRQGPPGRAGHRSTSGRSSSRRRSS